MLSHDRRNDDVGDDSEQTGHWGEAEDETDEEREELEQITGFSHGYYVVLCFLQQKTFGKHLNNFSSVYFSVSWVNFLEILTCFPQ